LVVCVVQLAGCVLSPPNHRAALAVNGLAAGIGLGLIVKDAWDCRDAGPEGCHRHSYPVESAVGSALLLGGVVLAMVTLAITHRATRATPTPATSPPLRSDAVMADSAR
jgi:hypothetical protein